MKVKYTIYFLKYKSDSDFPFNVNYPPTPKAMGWASRVNAPTNVGNLP